MNYPEFSGDYVRVGIALYGILSQRETNPRLDLKPVLSLKARVASVRKLHTGESAGYDLAFTAERETTLAALTIGYADGLPRNLSCGKGYVLIHGKKAPIAGKICMDQTLIDVTDIPNVRLGDTAVMIGQAGGQEISAYDLAEQTDTITNEILSRLGKRLKKIIL